MPRQSQSTFIEDLYAVAARRPWWQGALAAVLSFGALHYLASVALPAGAVRSGIARTIAGPTVMLFAGIFQYLLPPVLLAGAIGSVIGRRKRSGILNSVASDESGGTLRSMPWSEFELLVGEAFRQRGYTVTVTGGGGADGGVDLRLTKGRELLVQCKQWRAFRAPVSVVWGALDPRPAAGTTLLPSGG